MNDDDINQEFANIAVNDFADRIEALVEKIRACHQMTIDAMIEEDPEKFQKYSTEAVRLFSQVTWATMPTVFMASIATLNKERDNHMSTFACLIDMVENVKDWVNDNAPREEANVTQLARLIDLTTRAQAWIDRCPFDVETEKG